MIKLYYGNVLEECTDAILSSLAKKKDDRFCVVVAPDSYLFSIENKVAESGLTLDVEVMSFSRLARAVLNNKIKRCLTPEGCNLIMTKAINDCKDDLVYYRRSLSRKGFVNQMYSTVTALRNSGISVSDLTSAVSSMSGYVKNKTKDLATIYDRYLQTLSANYSDPTTRLQALVKEIPTNEFIKETAFYFVDFYAFNYWEYRVLQQIMNYAYSVDIGVIDCVGGLNRKSVYPDETSKTVAEFARLSGNKVERVNCYTALNEYERFISNDLFGISAPENVETNVDVEIIEPSSPYAEAKSVCCKIAELVRKGARYKDIAIVRGSADDRIIETFLKDYRIPYFVDNKVPLTDEPSVKYLLLSLACLCSKYEKEKILSFVKNPLSEIDAEDSMIFENYCNKYAINYTRFCQPFALGDDKERAIPEKVRKSIIEQIIDLPSKSSASEYANAVSEYLKTVDYDKRIENFFEKQRKTGDVLSVKRTAQIPRKLVFAIDLLGETLGEYEMSVEEFNETLIGGLESIKLSVVPLIADSVQIGAPRDTKFENIEYMFVIGATEGNIPMSSGEGTILTNKYHTDLQSFNMVVRPMVKEENKFGRFCFAQLLLRARKGLYVSCPKYNAQGEATVKSEIIAKYKSVIGVKYGESFVTDDYSAYVTEKQCLDEISVAIGKSRELNDFYSGLLSVLNDRDKDKIYNLYFDRDNSLNDGALFYDKSNTTTVSKIETFNCCPYRYFVQNGLKAKEKETSDIKVNETGSFIHDVLDKYFTEYRDRIETIDFDTAKINALKICDDILAGDDRLKGILESGQRKVDNLKTEASIIVANLNELSKKGKLTPFKTEVKFGFDDEDGYPAIELSSGTRVRGKIDRIDKYDDNIVVIDYKTGKVEADLTAVFYGEKVQLYVYLYALSKLGYKPVGAVYQHIDATYSKGQIPPYAYLGQIINSPEVIAMFDRDFDANESSRVLPIRKCKGVVKTLNGITSNKMLIDDDGMKNIIEYVKKLVNKADGLIKQGYIEPKPFEKGCEYCRAKNVCSLKEGYRKRKTVNTEDFIENEQD